MFFKHTFVTAAFVLCCLAALFGRGAASQCSLDNMRIHAMEACEDLLGALEIRERRSIDHGHAGNSANTQTAKYYHYVRRSNYPQGGYLKMGLHHYRKLSHLDVYPRYKAKKLSQIHQDEKMRIKRNDHSNINAISYCCFHKCDANFFC